MHVFSKFNAYNTNAHTHNTHRVMYQGNGTEEKFFKKRKVFKEDLKEVTEVYKEDLKEVTEVFKEDLKEVTEAE